ncbi:MAG: hypothetical protein ACYS1C_02865 [Planctomycetota bacterium]|jgi:hypothetical protein
MLNSGSCEGVTEALQHLAEGRLDSLTRRLPYAQDGPVEPELLRQVARDFASLLYSVLFQQMQKTVGRSEEEEGPLKEGVRDFMAMFLPQAMAEAPADALTRYIHEHLGARHGEQLDESA